MTPLSTHEARRLIEELLEHVPEDDDEAGFDVRASPSEKQSTWIKNIHEKIVGAPQYENLVSSGKVPLGRPVETPAVLKNLPKKPPGRR